MKPQKLILIAALLLTACGDVHYVEATPVPEVTASALDEGDYQ